jgi:hypothetical protein
MANDNPATRVEPVGFDDLIPIARRLNTASDDLNAALKRIEDRLNELGIGIDRFVPIPDTREVVSDGTAHEPEEWSEYQVGYDRVGDGWALLTRRAHFQDDPTLTASPEDCWRFDEVKPLLRSSRELRIRAVAAIPKLLEELKAEAEGVLRVVESARRLAGDGGQKSIDFEFGETAASNAFWDRNPRSFPALMRLVELTNRAFGREWKPKDRMQDIAFNLGQTCRQDFLEILFLAVNGHGIGAQKLLRGLYERAVSLEYIRQNPDKAERFVRFAAVQEHRVAKTAVELVGRDEFDRFMGTPFAELAKMYEQVKPEFQVTDCKKCDTKKMAFSWDIDIASMVNKLGEPYKSLYMAAYALPTLHIHATLASAFSREAAVGTREERNIQEAEVSLINATLILILVLNSQSEIFSLGLDEETKACWQEVTDVWKDRPHGAVTRRGLSPSATDRENI